MDVRVVNISKEFERHPALHDVSIDIRSGELIALLGPSGSGKTTLLRVIAGLERPNTGAIFFGDEDASQKSVGERNIGFVFQHYALFKHMTVAGNIGFGLKVRPRATRPGKAEIARRTEELLELVQLPGLGHRFPAQLSGGQRQRVALARALAIEPRVLLLDEPFGALDAKVRRNLRRWLRELHSRTGHTTVFVTHDQEEALELADRVAILSAGRLEQVGAPDEIYDHPTTPFVMSFVGETASIAVERQDHRLLHEGKPLEAEVSGTLQGPGRLYLRPHDVELTEPGAGKLSGLVTSVRRTAAGRRAHIDLGGDTVIEAELAPSVDVPAGRQVGLRILRGRLFER